MINLLATEQNQGIAKGLGVGLAAVLLAYAGLYGWTAFVGPAVREARESKLVSNTVPVDRVLPINPPIKAPPVTAPEMAVKTPVAEVVAPQADSALVTAPHAEATAPAEPVKTEIPAPVEKVDIKPVENEMLKGLQKYPSGLYAAPVDGLYEDSAEGRLPVLGKDGLSPFKAYRKPFVHDGNKPIISIAVADMGLSAKITESAIKSLPSEVSLIVSPYADGPDIWTKEAREAGHEVWLGLPVESANYPQVDPGPHTLLIGAPERENQQKLDWIMSRAVGYAGLVATYQPAFMEAQNDVRPVLGSIYKRGIGFIDSGTGGTLPETMAISMNAAYSNIDIWIDKPEATPEIINASLQQMEIIAKESGYAAGVISPSSISFRELQAWLATLKDKGILLAPMSTQTGY